jgi:hypothetical protein
MCLQMPVNKCRLAHESVIGNIEFFFMEHSCQLPYFRSIRHVFLSMGHLFDTDLQNAALRKFMSAFLDWATLRVELAWRHASVDFLSLVCIPLFFDICLSQPSGPWNRRLPFVPTSRPFLI